MIEGAVEVLEIDALPQERGDRLSRTRASTRVRYPRRTAGHAVPLATPYRWFRISPRRIQGWRELNEMLDRELMRDGRWLV